MSKRYSTRPVGWASVSDPATKLVGFKLEAVYKSDDVEQLETTNCPVCNAEIQFDPSTTQNSIEQVACPQHKFQLEGLINWKDVQPIQTVTKYKSNKPGYCPGCGGERRGRGYSHKNECNYQFVPSEENVENSDEINVDDVSVSITETNVKTATESFNKIIKDVCPECKGIPKGRGFAHKDNCSLSTKAKMAAVAAQKIASGDTCPICKGLKAGRGYFHTDECTESTKYKQNQQKELREKAINAIGEKPLMCPECNGPRKGRGYSHSDNCVLRTHQPSK